MSNNTKVTEFLLLGFSDIRELQLLHTMLLLLVYLASLMGNFLIIAVTTLDWHLHIPMYFFVKNLSILDFVYISVTAPKSIFNSLTNINSISLLGCAAQVFFVFLLGGSELALLTVMSYDRYVAICREDVSLAISLSLVFLCFVLIVGSYIRIFSAVLRMPSAKGRSKAFSTCIPHLVVVTVYITSGMSAYLKPISDSPSALDLLVPVFYAVVAPTLNPLIYSLRNRDVKAAMGRLLWPKHLTKEKISIG
ncbi:putative olfactory receptor 14L1 [Tachyglossus aculeatus]|uniref:putative olfactory receptor 14L1 n=1 Tax=Tachyglossus aculeatus TaxID=9261 RepID=UPI0018F5B87C|nr:putative olfactory receptor 14L1 [Tachyglossus aculeatus]